MSAVLAGEVISAPSGRKDYLSTANPFEKEFGYYRAVRHGQFIFVSGTTALKPVEAAGPVEVHFKGDIVGQAQWVFDECVAAIGRLGGSRKDVVRVRMFVANPEDCEAVGKQFRQAFGRGITETGQDRDGYDWREVGAAATMIVVNGGFVNKDILLEVEVDAIASL